MSEPRAWAGLAPSRLSAGRSRLSVPSLPTCHHLSASAPVSQVPLPTRTPDISTWGASVVPGVREADISCVVETSVTQLNFWPHVPPEPWGGWVGNARTQTPPTPASVPRARLSRAGAQRWARPARIWNSLRRGCPAVVRAFVTHCAVIHTQSRLAVLFGISC